MEAHMLEQARRAVQTVDRDWMPVAPIGIGGVHLKELKNVVIRSGILTECFRPEWFAPPPVPGGARHLHVIAAGRRLFMALSQGAGRRDHSRSRATANRHL